MVCVGTGVLRLNGDMKSYLLYCFPPGHCWSKSVVKICEGDTKNTAFAL